MDYFSRLAERAMQRAPTVRPRIPSLFSPRTPRNEGGDIHPVPAESVEFGPGHPESRSHSAMAPRPDPAAPAPRVDPGARTRDRVSPEWIEGPTRPQGDSHSQGPPPAVSPPPPNPTPPIPVRVHNVTRPKSESGAALVESGELHRPDPRPPIPSPPPVGAPPVAPGTRTTSEPGPIRPSTASPRPAEDLARPPVTPTEVRALSSGATVAGPTSARVRPGRGSIEPVVDAPKRSDRPRGATGDNGEPAKRGPSRPAEWIAPAPARSRSGAPRPPVQVHIGRVEVRAVMGTPPAPAARRGGREPRLSLAEYLRSPRGSASP